VTVEGKAAVISRRRAATIRASVPVSCRLPEAMVAADGSSDHLTRFQLLRKGESFAICATRWID